MYYLHSNLTIKQKTYSVFCSGGAKNIHLGAIADEVWGTEVPQWVQGRSPGRRSGDAPRSWSTLQTSFADFDFRNDQSL